MNKNVLIIFTKNAELGKVKTRLGKSIGIQQAFIIHEKLVQHTSEMIAPISFAEKHLYFSDHVERGWETIDARFIQEGDDLGQRMRTAFANAFSTQASKVVIIGTDCIELTEQHIQSAFELLEEHKVVIGPAKDGGYYLLGTSAPFPCLFEGIEWSSDSVLRTTIKICDEHRLSYVLLPVLQDLDTEEDLKLLQQHYPQLTL